MTILITGAAGFIGSHLTDHLLQHGHTVIGIDNYDNFYAKELKEANIKNALAHRNFKLIEGCIAEKETYDLIDSKPDLVIHLAAKAGVLPSIKDPAGYIRTNISGTHELLEYMRVQGITKLLFASSSSVYGNNKETPFSETHNVDRAISPYAFTKKACEVLIHTHHHLHNLDAICMRFFTVFGPRQRPDLAIRKFITLINNNEPIEMYGKGDSARDYTYVEDTVQGIVKLMQFVLKQQSVYEIVNLGNSTPVSLKDMIDTIYTVLGAKKNIVEKPMQAGDVNITYADITKAQELVGYSPKTSLEEGVRKFISWLQ